jgi:uroporphyrinogen decarboxylase
VAGIRWYMILPNIDKEYHAMTHRERVKKAIHFNNPDRLPHFLPDDKENDLIWLWPQRPDDLEPWHTLDGGRQRRRDCWGVVWETVSPGSYGEAVDYPVGDITRQAECVIPDLNKPEFFEAPRKAILENNSSVDPKYCLGKMPFSSLIIGRLAQKQRESIRTLAEIGCDGVMGYDDWGLQDRLMVSLDLIEEFFLPHYRENWKLAHDLGMDVWMHSCGYTVDLLPLLADAGLNVIQMDQQENVGLERLDEAVGGRLAFWCPVDVQKTMVEGSVDDIRNYVKRMISTIGSHYGGLVSMAYSTPEACGHDPEKTAAMCAAFREFGKYENGVNN